MGSPVAYAPLTIGAPGSDARSGLNTILLPLPRIRVSGVGKAALLLQPVVLLGVLVCWRLQILLARYLARPAVASGGGAAVIP